MRTTKLTYYFFFIFFCALFYSCSDNREIHRDLGTDSGIKKDWRIKNILSGVWVPDEYIKLIESTKSPYKSSDVLTEVSTMIIECDSSVADSLIVGVSWNNHEGGNFTVYFDSTNYLLTSIPDYEVNSNTYRLAYDIVKSDTLLMLAHFDKDNHLLDQKKFRRVLQNQTSDEGADWGLTVIVNDRIFRGQYERLESIVAEPIVLSNSGEVQNFYDFKSYQVLTDFIGPTNFDNICFKTSDSKYSCFAFKFSVDTLRLYELVPTEEDGIEKVGAIKYTLIKTRD